MTLYHTRCACGLWYRTLDHVMGLCPQDFVPYQEKRKTYHNPAGGGLSYAKLGYTYHSKTRYEDGKPPGLRCLL